MSRILVCGLVNNETSAYVEKFPIEYRPIDYRSFGVSSAPGGVGLNIAVALSTLSDEVHLCSLCGDDSAGKLIRRHLDSYEIDTQYILSTNKATAQSVVLYDSDGRRYIICDLADNQEASYNKEVFREALRDSDIACLCNINYAAELIPIAKEMDVPIATDVHCLWDVNDEYNRRFMSAADIIFLSNENIIGREESFAREIAAAYSPCVIVVGMGAKGALLYTKDDDSLTMYPAVYTRPVVNTVGAGDSLYSAFIHFYAKCRDPRQALHKAMYFASYKIGESGASKGFLTESQLLRIIDESGD